MFLIGDMRFLNNQNTEENIRLFENYREIYFIISGQRKDSAQFGKYSPNTMKMKFWKVERNI